MSFQFKHDRRKQVDRALVIFPLRYLHSSLTLERKRGEKGGSIWNRTRPNTYFQLHAFHFHPRIAIFSYVHATPREEARNPCKARILIYLEATRELVKRAPIYKINHWPGSGGEEARKSAERERGGGGAESQRAKSRLLLYQDH